MKDLTVFQVEGFIGFDYNTLPSLIHVPLTSLQQEKVGFTPLYEEVLYNTNIEGFTCFKIKLSTRAKVKEDTLAREYESRIKRLERNETPYNMDQVLEEVRDDLTRMANISDKEVLVFLDHQTEKLLVGGNVNTALQILPLMETLIDGDVKLELLTSEPSDAQEVLTSYIMKKDVLPSVVELGEKIKLGTKTLVGKKPKSPNVTITGEYVDNDEVRKHINSGKVVHSLQLDWDGVIYFNIDHKLAISCIAFEEHLKYTTDPHLESDVNFESEWTLRLNELREVVDVLTEELTKENKGEE